MKKNLKRFYILNFFLFAFFFAWAVVLVVLSGIYSKWILVIALAPLFTSLVFLNIILKFTDPLWSLFAAYPLLELVVKIFKLNYSKFRRDIIYYSNKNIVEHLVRKRVKYNADKILVLLPHCIQRSDCQHRITWEKIDNCKKCKKCPVCDFVEIKQKYGVSVAVVSGGTAAREMIKLKRPELIIAVACENDLVSGLREVRKTPVIAVLNQINSGPCRDTTVDPKIVMEYLKSFMREIPLA
jgi:uncharacterized protein